MKSQAAIIMLGKKEFQKGENIMSKKTLTVLIVVAVVVVLAAAGVAVHHMLNPAMPMK